MIMAQIGEGGVNDGDGMAFGEDEAIGRRGSRGPSGSQRIW